MTSFEAKPTVVHDEHEAAEKASQADSGPRGPAGTAANASAAEQLLLDQANKSRQYWKLYLAVSTLYFSSTMMGFDGSLLGITKEWPAG